MNWGKKVPVQITEKCLGIVDVTTLVCGRSTR